VTIFESENVPGGMLSLAIPEYRLPKEILNREISEIQRLGVEIRLNSPIGENGLTLEELKRQGFSAIFLGVGAHKGVTLDIPNENIKGIVHGTSWLKDIKKGKETATGEKVVVIGGGNVAIDSARTALRLGAKDVSIIYRRSSEEMPAIKEEVEAALEEGVKIRYMASPCRIVCEEDECRGVECFETELGQADESGRRRPIQIEDSEFTIDADLVVSAIGEVPALDFLDDEMKGMAGSRGIQVNATTFKTEFEGIFAGGDVVTGPATVVEAIAAGGRAAMAIDRYLKGEPQVQDVPESLTIGIEDIDTSIFKKRERVKMPTLPSGQRIEVFDEVETGFTELDALREADRCLQCGMFPKK
jgi:NADPH-dependent glutamate synthase beta subunit-like oxidoreductase